MLTISQLEALRPELDAWNLRQQQARNEYARHPIAACAGIRRIEGEAVPCDAMAITGDLCRHCLRDRRDAAKRMRNLRLLAEVTDA